MNQGITSINDLPSSLSGNIPAQKQQINLPNNIVLKQKEISQPNTQMQNPPPQIQSLQQNIEQQPNQNYNEMINQLQKAIHSGATNLPSRDIPIDPNLVNNDPTTKPNYVPQTNNTDYIQNNMNINDLINEDNIKNNNESNIELLIKELQIPIIISLLFFIFQMPIFKKYIKNTFSFIVNKDGNLNINGYIFNSILFGTAFYIIIKIMTYITNYVN